MDNQDKEELRKYERFPFRKDILIDGAKQCAGMDISEGGIYVSAIQYFEEGGIIDITLPFKDRKITVKGQVQYFQNGIGAGINFIDLNDEQKAIIKEIIAGISGKTA